MAESNLLQKWVSKIANSYDEDTGANISIPIEHEKIHEGNFYSISINNSAVANSSWVIIQINSASSIVGKELHLKDLQVNNSGGICEFLIMESPTTMVTGSASLSFINRNRNSTNSHSFVCFSDPAGASLTSTATSTQVLFKNYFYIGSTGTASNRGGAGEYNVGTEYILKWNTTYILKVTNLSGGASYCSMRLFGYEVEE